ncbi:MAG: endonuclease III [Verrucomicrobiales bacterium]|nr:endonuclease III [Verrucomicrobiales bacterium]
MRRETQDQRRQRLDRIRSVLKSVYPDAHCELVYRNPLELLVATVLSAQCTDLNVNRVTATLFRKYRTASDYAAAPEEELALELRSLGLFRNKAKNLKSACRTLVERHGGEVPQTLDALTELAGVGRKTANVVLGNAFGLEEGVVVDTHVLRLSRRLGITTETDPVKVERVLMGLVPRDEWTRFSHWLIWHGRRRCGARKPDCRQCELRSLCPSAIPGNP